MTEPTPWIMLGTVGRMVRIASPEKNVVRTPTKISTISESINGTLTEDLRGVRRSWEIETAYLMADDLAYLETCYFGGMTKPLRLRDPVNKNLLSASTSLGSKSPALSNGTKNWTPSVGISGELELDTPVITYSTPEGRTASYTTNKAIRWTTPSSGNLYAECRYDSGVVLGNMSVPVIPGERLVLSAYIRRISGSGNITLRMSFYNEAGVFTRSAGFFSTPTSWTRQTSYTTVAAGEASVILEFSSSAAGTWDFSHVQLESVNDPAGTTPTSWVVGAGCPHVLFTELGEVSPIYPLVTASIKLRER